jgi:hypothetical protein
MVDALVLGSTASEGKLPALKAGAVSQGWAAGAIAAGPAAAAFDTVVAWPTLGPGKPAIPRNSSSVTRLLSRADRTWSCLNIEASLYER